MFFKYIFIDKLTKLNDQLKMSEYIFTRYLYEKEEVGYSLVLSLLNKKEDEAIFWATELYYSGFENELYEILWMVFQNFYATLNIHFEHYLLKQIEILKSQSKDQVKKIEIHLHYIIKNLILKPYNLDTFSLIKIISEFEIENCKDNQDLEIYEEVDYLQITKLIIENWREKDIAFLETQLEMVLDFWEKKEIAKKEIFLKDWNKMKQLLQSTNLSFSPQILLLTRVFHFHSLYKKLKMGTNLRIILLEEEEINQQIALYRTVEVDLTLKEGKRIPKLPAYQILPKVRIHSIHPEINGLFQLKRSKNDDPLSTKSIKSSYLNETWLYCASFSPIWEKRILEYKGRIVSEERKVLFEEDDCLEDFYTRYGYEPDEQIKECHEKSTGELINTNWKKWIEEQYEKPKQNRLYKIEDEYLAEL